MFRKKPSTVNNSETSSLEQQTEFNGFPGRETIERIRKGWNIEEANTITVGDLFLMVYILFKSMLNRSLKLLELYSSETHHF